MTPTVAPMASSIEGLGRRGVEVAGWLSTNDGSSQSSRNCRLPNGMLRNPATTEKNPRMMSGMVMVHTDSWGS